MAFQQRAGTPLRRPGLCYTIAYVVLLVVAVLSLMPAPDDLPGNDKILHFITYAGLSAGYALLVQRLSTLLVIALGLVLYGIALEFLQGMTGYRMYDPHDMLANSIGVLCGLVVWMTPIPRWFRRLENRLG